MKGDPVFATIAGHLKGTTVRVGGITADWTRYVPDAECGTDRAHCAPVVHDTVIPRLGGFWPTAPRNLSYSDFDALVSFFSNAGITLLFDLNELYGRDCQTSNPAYWLPQWCVGAWDTSNLVPFLQHIHDTFSPQNSSLMGLELGNELVTHLDASNNTADILTLATLVAQVWADAPEHAPQVRGRGRGEGRNGVGVSCCCCCGGGGGGDGRSVDEHGARNCSQ